jgi:small subunit ribosomal protein S12
MVTLRQCVRKDSKRSSKKRRCFVPALLGAPMKWGSVVRLFEQTPKKPNSARRKVAKVRIKQTNKQITVHIPGEGHNLNKHSTVMIRGGRCQDLIGVRYKPIRPLGSFSALERRATRLSKYGISAKKRRQSKE